MDGRGSSGLGRPVTTGLLMVAALLVGAAAWGTVLTMAWAAGVGQPGWLSDPVQLVGIVFVALNLLPHAWALSLASSMRTATEGVVVAAGSLTFAAVDAWFLQSFVVSESSTSALIFLTLPLLLGLVVVPIQLLIVVVRRRAMTGIA